VVNVSAENRGLRKFEYAQFDIICTALPNNVVHANNGRAAVDLEGSLKSVAEPKLILQLEVEPEQFRDFAPSNIGVRSADLSNIPTMSGLRPDVVFADLRRPSE
jgi:hypothetical protein